MTIRSSIASLALVTAGLVTAVPAHAGTAGPAASSATSSAAASATAFAASSPTGQRAVTRIDYPGTGVQVARLSGDERRLRGTPAGFKGFVHARLDRLFREAGSRPGCATAPTVVVQRYHGTGWAAAGEGWYEPCPQGGYAVLYRRAGSHWGAVLPSQDLRFCEDLAWYAAPGFVAGRSCLTEDLRAVPYRTHDERGASPAASARRATGAANGRPSIPQRHVSLPTARARLRALVDGGARLDVDRCVSAGDGDPLDAHLGDAAYGCAVVASYRRRPAETYLLRMATAGDDVLVTDVVPAA